MSTSSFYDPSMSHSTPLPQGSPADLPRSAARSDPGSYEVTAFVLGSSACNILCVPLKSCFPQSWGTPATKPHFKAKCFRGSSSQCQTFGQGGLTWGSEFSLLWECLCNIIIIQNSEKILSLKQKRNELPKICIKTVHQKPEPKII